jgi:MFS transporter, OPA family, solute carrier family 37 (glycerol-3-phosphate transporter), member 1/2
MTPISHLASLLIPMVALVADSTMGIVTPRHERDETEEQGQIMAADEGPAPITHSAALQVPMVAQYAVAFGFFKLTNYVLFFWLPYFRGTAFDPVTANLIAALYSMGMMVSEIFVGYASDFFGGRRAVVIGVLMCALIVFLGVFALYSEVVGRENLSRIDRFNRPVTLLRLCPTGNL